VTRKPGSNTALSLADSSVVKLSPKCFVEPYNYTQRLITDDMLRQLKNYLRNRTTPTSFTVRVRHALHRSCVILKGNMTVYVADFFHF